MLLNNFTKFNFFRIRIFPISILAIIFSIGSATVGKGDTVKLMDLFGDVFDKIKRDYVEDVTDKDLIEVL